MGAFAGARVCARVLHRQHSTAHTLCGLNSYFWCNFTGLCGMRQRCVDVRVRFPPGSHEGQEDMDNFTLGEINRGNFSRFDFQTIPTVNENTGGISCKGS